MFVIDFSTQKRESDEVFLSTQRLFSISKSDIQNLVEIAKSTKRNRVRYCSHNDALEVVQEMFIVHPFEAYVRPHKHIDKIESILVLDGEVDYVIFEDNGEVKEVVSMGDYRSGKSFYQSVRADYYHTLLIRSEWLVFLEITKGPFNKNETIFSEWSPQEEDIVKVKEFQQQLSGET